MHTNFFAFGADAPSVEAWLRQPQKDVCLDILNESGRVSIFLASPAALVAFGERIAAEGRRLLGEPEETVCLADILAAPAANPFA